MEEDENSVMDTDEDDDPVIKEVRFSKTVRLYQVTTWVF